MSEYLEKVSNEILGATERVAAAVEEGASILFGESSSSSTAEEENVGGGGASDDFHIGGEEEDMLGGPSPLDGIAEGVLGDIMSSQSGPQTPWEHFQAFRHAINWTEPFLLYLITFHLLIFAFTIYTVTKGTFNTRILLLITLFILVRSSQHLNEYGRDNWEELGITQNYFDKGGIFIGLMYSSPLLLDCVVMLICYLKEASGLLVEVKKMEIAKKKKDKSNKDAGQVKKETRGKTNKKKTTKKD